MSFFVRFLRCAFLCYLAALPTTHAHLHEGPLEGGTESEKLDELVISESEGDSPRLKKSQIEKTEVISRKKIEQKRAQTLSDAVKYEVGVDAQNSCANCGSKRLTINGLRGEQTTLLIDGMPLHSTVSSFYGLDAIPAVGVESIEISRGAGNALVSPESIGGVVNVITARARSNQLIWNEGFGTHGNFTGSALGTLVGDEGRNRWVATAQWSEQGVFDVDENGVSEAPNLKNQSGFLKYARSLTPKDTIEARIAHNRLTILGGTTDKTSPNHYYVIDPLNPHQSFQDNDTSKKYLDAQSKITDRVRLDRSEAVLKYGHAFGESGKFELAGSFADQRQDSIYLHGYDYQNHDQLFFGKAETQFALGESHLFSLGLDLKRQTMDSGSEALYIVRSPVLPKDSFRFQSQAGYLQDHWFFGSGFEMNAALRVDTIKIRWTDLNSEVDRTVFAPRVQAKLEHSNQFTSRLSYGLGYRSPLSFFESQHGLDEAGFQVGITEIEKAHAIGYSLQWNTPAPKWSAVFSAHTTALSNMAYARPAPDDTHPALFLNDPKTHFIHATDLVLDFDAGADWDLELGVERFWLPLGYKAKLPAAAVENRVRLTSDYHWSGYELVANLTWVGPRNLNEYGYGNDYRTFVAAGPDTVGEAKPTHAPGYLTLDLLAQKPLSQKWTLYASIFNVFDTTQTSLGDSPLSWRTHGTDPADFHLDNNHLWGPIRGRTFLVGVKVTL